jgi:hypothetical protein
LKKILLEDLSDQIEKLYLTNGVNVIIDNSANVNKKWSSIRIFFSETSKYAFGIDCSAQGFNGVAYGIVLRNQSDDSSPELAKWTNSNLLGDHRNSPSWPWYRCAKLDDNILPMSTNWDKDPQPWTEIAERVLAAKIVEAAEMFRSAINDADIL